MRFPPMNEKCLSDKVGRAFFVDISLKCRGRWPMMMGDGVKRQRKSETMKGF